MRYDEIDPIIRQWISDYRLHLHTEYKEAVVRSTDVVSSSGDKVQIWVDPPQADGPVSVHVWNYGERKQARSAASADLRPLLDRPYEDARAWLGLPGDRRADRRER